MASSSIHLSAQYDTSAEPPAFEAKPGPSTHTTMPSVRTFGSGDARSDVPSLDNMTVDLQLRRLLVTTQAVEGRIVRAMLKYLHRRPAVWSAVKKNHGKWVAWYAFEDKFMNDAFELFRNVQAAARITVMSVILAIMSIAYLLLFDLGYTSSPSFFWGRVGMRLCNVVAALACATLPAMLATIKPKLYLRIQTFLIAILGTSLVIRVMFESTYGKCVAVGARRADVEHLWSRRRQGPARYSGAAEPPRL